VSDWWDEQNKRRRIACHTAGLEETMTKRQANTIMGLCTAIILTQILCTAALLCSQERTRKEAEVAQVRARDVMEIERQVRDAAIAEVVTLHTVQQQIGAAHREIEQRDLQVIQTTERLERDSAELEARNLELKARLLAAQERDGAIINEGVGSQNGRMPGARLIPLAK
jgi:hypothetical protein